jgi:hypothetical protein
VDDLVHRLQIWMECLRKARQEYSAGRIGLDALI